MKVTMKTPTDSLCEERGYNSFAVIEIDGEPKASFYDGEPEDNNLSRNFSNVYDIPNLLQEAHRAGQLGEEFEYLSIEVDSME